ncbi:MAG TPA: anti-sigma factor [Gemmatimonadaceae bacterium]|nr:anti-sigma factor [Gemmatimonadaceae bacterium]
MSNDNERNEEDARDHRAREDGAHDRQNTGQPIAPTTVNEPESAFDVAGAALGALTPGEEADVYTAASVDSAVSAELAAMEAVVAELARLAPVQQMNRGRSAGIRSRLVARAAATNVGRQASSTGAAAESEHAAARPIRPTRSTQPSAPRHHPSPSASHGNASARHTPLHVVPFEPRRRPPIGRMFAGVALAAALVIAAFGVYSWRERSRIGGASVASAVHDSSLEAQVAQLRVSVAQKDSLISALTGMHTRVIDLMSYADAAPMARMFWDQKKQMFIMYASNVKPPAQGKVYQVWLIARGTTTPVSVGTFMPDSTGSAVVSARHPMEPGTLRRVAVTEEPDGGMPAPTGPVMFAGVGK